MEIFGTTTYVDPAKQKEPWYQLEVINQWDWLIKVTCRKGDIPYCVTLNTAISDRSYISEKVEFLNDEMKDCLIKKGYTINK